jgi:hypothetical protein
MESDNLAARLAILDVLADYAMGIESDQYRDRVVEFLDDMRRWSGSLTPRQLAWLEDIAEESGEFPLDVSLGSLTKRISLFSIETLFG